MIKVLLFVALVFVFPLSANAGAPATLACNRIAANSPKTETIAAAVSSLDSFFESPVVEQVSMDMSVCSDSHYLDYAHAYESLDLGIVLNNAKNARWSASVHTATKQFVQCLRDSKESPLEVACARGLADARKYQRRWLANEPPREIVRKRPIELSDTSLRMPSGAPSPPSDEMVHDVAQACGSVQDLGIQIVNDVKVGIIDGDKYASLDSDVKTCGDKRYERMADAFLTFAHALDDHLNQRDLGVGLDLAFSKFVFCERDFSGTAIGAWCYRYSLKIIKIKDDHDWDLSGNWPSDM